MDYKEIKDRLEELGDCVLMTNGNMTINSRSSFNPQDMRKVYELVKDGDMFLTEAYKKVTGKKANGDLIKRWFDNRGWTLNLIKGSRDDKFYQQLQEDINNDMTDNDICEKYNITPIALGGYYQRKKVVKKNGRGAGKRIITQMIKEGKTNQEIYDLFPDRSLSSISAQVCKIRKELGINIA